MWRGERRAVGDDSILTFARTFSSLDRAAAENMKQAERKHEKARSSTSTSLLVLFSHLPFPLLFISSSST
eukprot:310636-Hanusia_phi.AAC.1